MFLSSSYTRANILIKAGLLILSPFVFANDFQLILFYSKYCQHCESWLKNTGATYETDAPEYLQDHTVALVKYDISEPSEMQLYQRMLKSGQLSQAIPGVPTFIIADNSGKELARGVGAMPKTEFYQFLTEATTAAAQTQTQTSTS